MNASRSTSATYKGRAIDVNVDLLHDHSHIVVAVRNARRPALLEEYITEHADADEALDAGLRIGQTLVDRQAAR